MAEIIKTGELIPISENNGKRAVSARELHKFLESKQDFSTWIKNRIEKYDLVENVDYEVFHNFMENPNGGRPLIEYALTIEAAKELSMVEGNERGKMARKYFISCEQKLKEISSPSYMISDPIKRAEKWIEEEKVRQQLASENEKQAAKIAQDAPRVLFSKAVETAKRSCLIAELAKILQQNGISIGQNRLFKWLRKHGYLCSKGQYYNQPTQKSFEMGLFEIKQTTINRPDGTVMVSTTTKCTGKGQIYFVNKFLSMETIMVEA